MSTKSIRAFLATGALAAACASWGCVADRPARNGVFNENQYLRKAFIIRAGDGSTQDTGWMLKATIVQVSTPNPLGSFAFLGGNGVFSGTENGGELVRFAVTSDKLQMLDMRALSNDPPAENATTPPVVNSWAATNVDLKYRVNLDGEKTNFYEENQELDWQVRQWVKLNFDKNDMSDFAPFGAVAGGGSLLEMCTDVANYAVTLVPNSFLVDEPNDYMEWTVSITMPLIWSDPNCVTAFGAMADSAERLGRQSVTANLKYSLVRANPAPTYQPLIVGEKDPIRHKYGTIDFIAYNRDPNSGLVAATQMANRFDPMKPIVWYVAPGFPTDYLTVFSCQGTLAAACAAKGMTEADTIEGQTNGLMTDAKAPARMLFLNHNDDKSFGDGAGAEHVYGDVRYNIVRWMSDEDMQEGFAGVTQFVTDPRTGEELSSSVSFNDFQIKDYYVQRIDSYLQTVGASLNINSPTEWPQPAGTCKVGQTSPIVQADVLANLDGNDSLYQKMQTYLGKDQATYGNLGPSDFIVQQDPDFFNAYYTLLPYEIYADPDTNPFVIREGGQGVTGPDSVLPLLQQETNFQALAASIDHGNSPYEQTDDGMSDYNNALGFLNNLRTLTEAHKQLGYTLQVLAQKQALGGHTIYMDPPEAFSFETIIQKDARHCILNNPADPNSGTHWETKEEWTTNLLSTYWSQTIWHEFGHTLGLDHNFMASVDRNNFPTFTDASGTHITYFANSVMEYNGEPDRLFWHAGWAPYDQGAISWIYANAQTPKDLGSGLGGANGPYGAAGTGITQQKTPLSPWRDPHGFLADGKTENVYLFCAAQHMKYTPLCRQGDSGTTPSEIMANEISTYEWQYQWRNFRNYLKIWDNSAYANQAAGTVIDMRRFLSQWIFDWDASDLATNFRKIGIQAPGTNVSQVDYYTQLTNKFNSEVSGANQMVAAFHKAIINESSGERPYATIYDTYYGDVTQQGIILDKLFAMQGWVALWPTDNYNQNEAGVYVSSYGLAADLDPSYQAIAEDAVNSMIGGQYDVYPYFVPLAVAQFAQDTHSPNFSGRVDARDWIGGQVFGGPEVDPTQQFLDYFRNLAVQNNFPGCPDLSTCTYDPRPLSDTHNQFMGPDERVWIWALIADRNQIVAVEKERNTASYVIVRNYTDDVIFQQDDGAFPGGAYGAELPMKYFLDSFTAAN